MYIPEFLCGVFATIITEVTIVIISVIVIAVKDGSKEAKQILSEEGSGNAHEGN